MGQLVQIRHKITKANVRPLPGLLEVPIRAFEWFCFEGIREVFNEVFPIVSNDENYELHFNDYEIVLPNNTVRNCFEKDTSYYAKLRGIFSFHNNKTGEIKEQEVFICELPFMTKNGTFVINGVERVVINQLVRAPGVYFTKGEKRTANEKAHMVKLIPYRGAWLRYEYDVKTASYQVRMDSPRRVLKVPIMDFLRALGFEIDDDQTKIFMPQEMLDEYGLTPEQWPNPEMEIEEGLKGTLDRDTCISMRDAQIEIWRKLNPTDPYGDPVLKGMLPSRFFDPKRYDLAKVGRYTLNNKLGLSIPSENQTLTVADIFEAFRLLFMLQEHKAIPLDDIDHLNLENRRVEHVGELLVSQFRKGLLRVERIVKEKLMLQETERESPKTLINTRPIIGVIKEFFGSSQMSQFMDSANPLTSLTHKRRFSALGPKGLTREAARFDFRDVHHSHYGRICPIESPEGPNIGLISSLACYARVNKYGFIETPYYKVENGVVDQEMVFLSADLELDYAIAPSTTKRDKNGCIAERILFVRRRGDFEKVAQSEVQYLEVAPNQFISVTTGLIPFLEHDDANRALMGSNMQRQAVPLLHPDSPLIGTGIERKLAEDAGGLEISPFCGEVTYVDSCRITLRKGVVYDKLTGEIMDLPNLEKIEGEEVLNKSKYDYMFTPPHLQHELYRKLPFEDRGFRKLRKSNDHVETIHLRKFSRSNQGTLVNQRVVVRKGYPVIKGDLLADNSSTSNGELALGQNVLIAFMSWRGYNFEDAILVSERVVKDHLYTSIHIEKHEAEARQTKLGPEKITREITGLHEEYIERNLDERGIVRIGAEVKSGDVLVGKITPKGESDLTGEEKLIRAVFGDKGKGFKNTPLKVPHGGDGVIISTSYFNREDGDELPHNVTEMARVNVVKRRNLQVGDKMAGRHGNKGVVSNILPEEDMPFLPDGTPVQIILNPLGVPSRMNIGQVLETHLGLSCSQISNDDDAMILKVAKAGKGVTIVMDKDDVLGDIDQIHFNKLANPLRVICPVFESPTEQQIRGLFSELNLPLDGKTLLLDGMTGEFLKERVMVGVMYFLKLNHLVDDKIHARSTGSYALITQQPLGGKAQFGGQRLGEMEVWALEGYGAAYLLKEMLTVKSDDVIGRNNAYKAIVDNRIIPEPGIPESFHVMVNELKSLGLDINVNFTGTEAKNALLGEEPATVAKGDDSLGKL